MTETTFPDAVLDETARKVDEEAKRAYQRYLELIDAGVPPRDAMQQVMATFDAAYYEALAAAFSVILAEPWTPRMVRDYRVGGLPLSARLYRSHREVAAEAQAIIAEHLKGLQQARQLALALYEGYGYRGVEPLAIRAGKFRQLPIALRRLATEPAVRRLLMQTARRTASTQLRTTGLRSAYTQAFDAAIKGAARPKLEALLRVAVEEKNRYFANRIAQTELARAHSNAIAEEFMADTTLEVVQWRLSGAHPRPDICDLLAKVDRYGLGPGCYPKAVAPNPVAHPWCRCRLRSRPDLSAADAVERPASAAAYLAAMSESEAGRLLGSKARASAVRKGRDPVEVWNDAQRDEYAIRRLGQVARAAKRRVG